jgi:hypothetical protein
MATDVTLNIDSISLSKNDGVAAAVGVDKNALAMKLLFPRMGKAEVTAIRPVKVTSTGPTVPGPEMAYTTAFKERIEGKCELVIEWVATDTATDREKMIATILRATLTAGLGVATAGIGSVVLAGFATAFGTFAIGKSGQDKDDIKVLGRGVAKLNEADLGTYKPITVEIKPVKAYKVKIEKGEYAYRYKGGKMKRVQMKKPTVISLTTRDTIAEIVIQPENPYAGLPQ